MQDFYLPATNNTPEITGNFETGEVIISGKCYPVNSIEFFDPFKLWITGLFETELKTYKLILDLEYFNTSSSIILLELMKTFKKNNQFNQILWMYEEDDYEMIEAGSEYNIIIKDGLSLVEKAAS